jgi:hypothetical protein
MSTYSFRSHTFRAARPGDLFVSLPPPPERIEERTHVPYSAINIVDDGGDGLRVWQVTVYCTSSERTNILADRGQVGTLITPDETFPNSKLSQIRDAGALFDRSLYALSCEFLVGSS